MTDFRNLIAATAKGFSAWDDENRMRDAMTIAFGDRWGDHIEMIPTISGYHYLAKDPRGKEMIEEIAKRIPK